MKVDLNELKKIIEYLRKLESVELKDVVWIRDGKQIEFPPTEKH